MATTSKCPAAGCDSTSFEFAPADPLSFPRTEAAFAARLMFVQCSGCGAVVGVLDKLNAARIAKIAGEG